LQIGNATELDDWSNQAESIAARLLRQLSRDGWQGLGATESGFLPDLPAADLNRRLGAPDVSRFIAAPLWQGSSWETTPLARQYDCVLIKALHCEFGNGLLTRLVARLVELARIPAGMRTLAAQLNSPRTAGVSGVLPAGTGIGQVEAARGRLVHRVVLDDGYVGRYQILAPTEWNFHPAGVVARGLASLPDTDKNTLRRQAAMLVSSVDPCVGYDLQVH
jgi:coenzyme F420-reducing hydrogenase alpha subunit